MPRELFARIKELDECLIRNGFKKVDEIYDPEAFGNEIIVYVSTQLKMRIVKDRGFFCVEALPVDSKSDDWILISSVIHYMKAANSSFHLSKKNDEWERLINEICLNISAIFIFFDRSNYVDNIKKLNQ